MKIGDALDVEGLHNSIHPQNQFKLDLSRNIDKTFYERSKAHAIESYTASKKSNTSRNFFQNAVSNFSIKPVLVTPENKKHLVASESDTRMQLMSIPEMRLNLKARNLPMKMV